MSYEGRNPFSLFAGVDLTGSQYCAVTISAGTLVLPSAGGTAVGVLQTRPASGKSGTVIGPGWPMTRARYGGTVTSGAALKVDAQGRFVAASATDIAAGSALALAVDAGAVDENHTIIFFGNASAVGTTLGFDDIVLGTTAPSALTGVTYAQVTGTKTGVLAAGASVGQTKRIVQSVAASTPIGTITGAFKTLAGAAATTLALGTAVAFIADFVWDGAAWRATSAIGGTGSSLA